MSFKKGDVVRAKYQDVQCYTPTGTVGYTSKNPDEVLGVATGQIQDDGWGRYFVQFVRTADAFPYNLAVLTVDQDLAYVAEDDNTLIGNRPAPAGNGQAGDPPTTAGTKPVTTPGGESLGITRDELLAIIRDSQRNQTASKVPVWAWVALGVVFVGGLILILVNRN